ncbi:MAG: hypothetical protein HOG05_07220 [Bacteroidetes bacterium]|nr:hypothetical protein [Bacteroidota bacterium]MBT5529369.1 hypothetical protein [Cytophagia bacterium]MBT7040238.1 hypothetical protein [Bacteroidota bacterium]
MKKLSFVLFVATILTFTCCDSLDIDPIIDNPVILDIKVNTTWETGKTYVIDGRLNIDGAILTIEPGVIVKFKEGAQIEVGSSSTGSAIIAIGTVDQPILFTSNAAIPSAGDWDAIFFHSGTASTTLLTYCNFEYGGGYSAYSGIIDLDEAEISMENCTIKHSAAYGIVMDAQSKFKSFTNNAISNTVNHVIQLYPNAAHTIGLGNVFTSTNPSIGILVKAATYNLAEETWLKQTVSYIIDGTMYLQSNAGSILNIQEGNTIAFTNGSQIEVGSSSSTYGTLKAIGTVANPILFTSSATSKTIGDWDGIFLEDGTSNNSEFAHCTFEYGGGYSAYVGMVDLTDCSVIINNCSFTNSATYGISLNDESYFVSFDNNTFSTCINHPIKLYANYAHTVGTGNIYNSLLGILVKADIYNQASETWKKQSCAYYIDGTMYIQSATSSELIIEAGNKILFTNGSQIEIGSASSTYGKLVAVGTPAERILFSTAAPSGSATAGDWDCIFFESGTSTGSILDYCDVSFGGGYSSYSGNIDLTKTGTTVTISNCTITDSESHGISVDDKSNPTLLNVTYANNVGTDYYVR